MATSAASRARNTLRAMPGWNYAVVWDGIAEIVPDREAVVCGDRRITWSEFSRRADTTGAPPRGASGAAAGDKIAIDLTNRNEYLETFYAALKLGCVPVNVNFRYRAEELHYLLENSDAKVLVYLDDFSPVGRCRDRAHAERHPPVPSPGGAGVRGRHRVDGRSSGVARAAA